MAAAAEAPDMAEHPAFRNSHENPFVPVPPPPRRTAPNSRVGLTDGAVPGQKPFVSGNSHRLGGGNGTGGSLPMRERPWRLALLEQLSVLQLDITTTMIGIAIQLLRSATVPIDVA
jgi:hypothetical protein